MSVGWYVFSLPMTNFRWTVHTAAEKATRALPTAQCRILRERIHLKIAIGKEKTYELTPTVGTTWPLSINRRLLVNRRPKVRPSRGGAQ